MNLHNILYEHSRQDKFILNAMNHHNVIYTTQEDNIALSSTSRQQRYDINVSLHLAQKKIKNYYNTLNDNINNNITLNVYKGIKDMNY